MRRDVTVFRTKKTADVEEAPLFFVELMFDISGLPIFFSFFFFLQGELIACSVVRRRCSHFSIIYFSETAWPIKFKCYVEHT